MSTKTLIADTATDMENIAASVAQGLRESGVGVVITLQGPLGAGKTTWCRGLLRALGYQGMVKSPTYTLVESYRIEQAGNASQLHHFDLYRLSDPEELEYIGCREYFDGASVCLIEWPELGHGVIPLADIVIGIEYNQAGSGRMVSLAAATLAGEQVLSLISC